VAGQVIARASGVALVEQEGKLHAVELGTAWAYTAGFVLGLITFIFGAFGAVQLVMALVGSSGILLLGLVFLPIAALGAAGLWLVVRYVRRRNAAPLGALPVRLVFDLSAGTLCTGDGQLIAPLASVKVHHKFQVTSSSRALEVTWSGGSTELVGGNPFAGGIGPIEDALRSRGIAVG
jgi:hypothetical protein